MEAPCAERCCEAADGKHTAHTQLSVVGDLERPREGQGQDEDDCVRHRADNGVTEDDGRLVEAFVKFQVPIGGDRGADADLQDPGCDVVDDQDDSESVDALHFFPVWGENSCDQGEEAELDGERHWGVKECRGIHCLRICC